MATGPRSWSSSSCRKSIPWLQSRREAHTPASMFPDLCFRGNAERQAKVVSAEFESSLVRRKPPQFRASFGDLRTAVVPGVRIPPSPPAFLQQLPSEFRFRVFRGTVLGTLFGATRERDFAESHRSSRPHPVSTPESSDDSAGKSSPLKFRTPEPPSQDLRPRKAPA